MTTQFGVRGQFGVRQCGVTIRRHLKQCGFRTSYVYVYMYICIYVYMYIC